MRLKKQDFSKRSKFGFVLEKEMGFSKEKLILFKKIANGTKFAVECVSNGNIS